MNKELKKKHAIPDKGEWYIDQTIVYVCDLVEKYFGEGRLNPNMTVTVCVPYFTPDAILENPDKYQVKSIQYGDGYVSELVYIYLVDEGEFKAGDMVVRVYERGGFPWYPFLGEDRMKFREYFDPENYGYTHEILDYANEMIKQKFPDLNLWFVMLDFDFLHIINLDKAPRLKRY